MNAIVLAKIARIAVRKHVRSLLLRCYNADNFGIKQNLVNRILNLRRQRSYRHRQLYVNFGRRFDGRSRNHRPKLIDEEMRDYLVTYFQDFPLSTVKDANKHLRQALPRKPFVRDSSLWTFILKKMNLTCKLSSQRKIATITPNILHQRFDFSTWLFTEGQYSNLIFIDETCLHMHMKRRKGWAPKGGRCICPITTQRDKNIGLVVAISKHGLLYYEFIEGTMNKPRFHEYLTSLAVVTGVEEEFYFVMDNAPCHRDAQVYHKNHHIRFIPPYSLDTNICENFFSVLKAHIKRLLSSDPILDAARFNNFSADKKAMQDDHFL